jgi:hypothetical protein
MNPRSPEHSHSHPELHHHEHDEPQHNHIAGEGPTVLDIGDDVGALVLYTSAEMVGAEIEISPDGDPHHRQHVAVHARRSPGGTAYAAVYYGLAAGCYELWAADGSVALKVSIEGNTITESLWPEGILAPR